MGTPASPQTPTAYLSHRILSATVKQRLPVRGNRPLRLTRPSPTGIALLASATRWLSPFGLRPRHEILAHIHPPGKLLAKKNRLKPHFPIFHRTPRRLDRPRMPRFTPSRSPKVTPFLVTQR